MRSREHEPGRRIVAVKNVTVNEEFFQGHFPGTPLMPGVLMIESLTQVATLLLFAGGRSDGRRAWLRGVDNAKFRRQVVPGDRLELEVTLGPAARPARAGRGRRVGRRPRRRRGRAGARRRAGAPARRAGERGSARRDVVIHDTAIVHPTRAHRRGHGRSGRTRRSVRTSSIGTQLPDRRVERRRRLDGDRRRHARSIPFASIGLAPQDLKYRGEPTRLVIGQHNVFREFVTIHRGTAGGGGVTTIGDHNLFMAYAHVAHDCHVGSHTIFGNAATLGGHVTVEDFATISAYSGVHQFCRVGQHAFIGGYTVVTRDALPYAKTVGNRARIYGVNSIGLARRGFSPELIGKLRRAYRHLRAAQHEPRARADRARPDARGAGSELPRQLHHVGAARRHPAAAVASASTICVDVE